MMLDISDAEALEVALRMAAIGEQAREERRKAVRELESR